jgi:hypothetical protein
MLFSVIKSKYLSIQAIREWHKEIDFLRRDLNYDNCDTAVLKTLSEAIRNIV